MSLGTVVLSTVGNKPSANRIDGWKSIGAYFGRDRTTAIRWARDRDLPVHRIPGGRTSTVYALRHELDQWAESRQRDSQPKAAGHDIAQSPPWGKAMMVALVGISVVTTSWLTLPLVSPATTANAVTLTLPRDPVTAQGFIKGRDLLADREASSIETAIKLLRDVTQREPGYGPAYAALAEALVLSREFGMRGDRQAFPEARSAAKEALRLTPSLASAHRVNGFIVYWWDQDFAAARPYFEKAIALAPGDAIGHFWYGNMLADYGNSADALRHLNKAQLMMPGSVPLQTDLAWALWSAGQKTRAITTLNDLARRHPGFSVIHDCLADIRLADGDFAGYVAAQSRVAALRQNATLRTRTAALSLALAKDPPSAEQLLLEYARADLASGESRTAARAAFVASAGRDRASLVAILNQARVRGERWGDAGLVRAIRVRWRADKPVQELLTELAQT